MLPQLFGISAFLFSGITLSDNQSKAATLEIHVHDGANLDERSLNQSLSTLRKILMLAGASPEIRVCGNPSTNLCGGRQEHGQKIVDLRISPRTADHPVNWQREPLGQSVVNDKGGVYGTIYLDSVKRQASAANMPWTILTGYVAAHEIGHLILGSTDHSPTGVMKANWDAKDMLAMFQNSVHFNQQQRRSIVVWCSGEKTLAGITASR
jgi:hypothetical protein